jgi:hypothetical protein
MGKKKHHSLWINPRLMTKAESKKFAKLLKDVEPPTVEELREAIDRGHKEAERLGFCTPVTMSCLLQILD